MHKVTIRVEINHDKIKHDRIIDYNTQKIIEENWVQFSRVLHASYEDKGDVSKEVFKLVRDIYINFTFANK